MTLNKKAPALLPGLSVVCRSLQVIGMATQQQTTKIFSSGYLNHFKYSMSRTDRLNPPAPVPETITLKGTTYNIKQLLGSITRSHTINLRTGKTFKGRPVKGPVDHSYSGRVPEFTIEDRRALIALTLEQIQQQYGLTAQQARNLRSNSLKAVETYEIRERLQKSRG